MIQLLSKLYTKLSAITMSPCHYANWIKTSINEYRIGDGIIIRVDSENDLPVIGKILKLYVVNGEICFEVRMFSSQYEPHYRVYTFNQAVANDIHVYHSEILMQVPVHIHSLVTFGHKKLFIVPHAVAIA